MHFFETATHWRRSLALAAVPLTTLLLPAHAQAWTVQWDPPAKLDGTNVRIQLTASNCPADLHAQLEEALEVWNSVPSSYLKLETTTNSSALTPERIMAGGFEGFAVACDPNYQANTTGDPNLTLGVTQTFARGETIVAAGIILNFETDAFTKLGWNAKVYTLAHELGHVLGLGHSSDPKALMHFAARPTDHRPTLAQDDIDGLTYLYPRNDFASDGSGGLFGCGSLEGPKDSSQPPFKAPWPGAGAFPILCLALILMLWRGRPQMSLSR